MPAPYRAPPAPLTPEDDRIWWQVRRALSRRWGLHPHAFVQDLAHHQDGRDAALMLNWQSYPRCFVHWDSARKHPVLVRGWR
jgi:hypothetical protein